MAADYVVRLQGQDNLSPTINNVKNALNGLSSTATGIDKIQDKFNRIQNSTMPLQRKLKEIKNLMAQLNLSGDSNSPIYNQMAQAAGAYADAIGDARDATNRFASDTMNLQAGIAALQGVAAAGSVAAGVMGLFGTENEKVTQAILKVQSAIAILNGVQSIANILNKDSVLIQKLKQIRIAASAAATSGETTALTANTLAQTVNTSANKKGTIAQNAWNIAKAVAKALVGDFTGLLIVGAGALATYAIATQDSTEKIESQEKSVSFASKAIENYNKSVGSSIGSVVGKFKTLQEQYKQLKTTAEKTQFIKDNQKAFEDLGLAIDSVVDAEIAFVKNADKVIDALVKIARAKAAIASTDTMWQDYYNDDRLTRRYTSEATISNLNQLKTDEDRNAAKKALKPYMSDKVWKEMEKTGAIPEQYRNWVKKAVNDEREAEAKAARERIQKDSEARIKEAKSLTDSANKTLDNLGINGQDKGSSHTKHTGSGGNNKSEFVDKNSIKFAEDKLKEYEEKLKKLSPNSKAFEETSKEVQKWTKELQNRKINAIISTNFDDDKLKEYQAKLKEIHEGNHDVNVGVKSEIPNLEKQIKNVEEEIKNKKELGVSVDSKEIIDLQNKLDKLNNIKASFELYGYSNIDDINKEIEDITKKIDVNVDVNDENVIDLQNKLNQLNGIKASFELYGYSNIDDINKEIENITKKIDVYTDVNDENVIDLQNKLNQLNNIKTSFELYGYSNIDDINKEIEDITKEIEVNVGVNDESVIELQDKLDKLNNIKASFELYGYSNIEDINKEIEDINNKIEVNVDVNDENVIELQDRLDRLNNLKAIFEVNGYSNIDDINKEIEDITKEIKVNVGVNDESVIELQTKLAQLNNLKAYFEINANPDKAEYTEEQLIKMIESREAIIKIGADYGDSLKGLNDALKQYQGMLQIIDPEDVELISELNKVIEETKNKIESTEVKLGIKPVIEEGSLNKIEEQIKKLEDEKARINVETNPEKVDELNNKIKELRDKKVLIEIVLEGENPNSLNGIDSQIKLLQNKLVSIDITTNYDEFIRIKNDIKSLEDKKHIIEIQASSNPVRAFYDDIQSKISEVQANFDDGLIDLNTAKQQVDAYNEELAKIGAKPIKLEFQTNFDKTMETINAGINNIQNISSVISSFQNLSKSIEEGADAFTIFNNVMNIATSIFGTIQTVMQTYNALSSIFTAKKTAEGVATATAATQITAGETAKAAADTASVGPAVAATVAARQQEAALLDLAAAQIFAAHASIPFAGVPTATAFIATMMSAMAAQAAASQAVAAFAGGGIVQGNSFMGDRLLARVNSGEMILNSRQQENLFRAIDENRLGGNGGVNGKVKFEIEGKVIKGVLDNYNSKNNKIK